MPNPLAELETVLQQLIAEHEKLLSCLDAQQAAMKKLDAVKLEDLSHAQETLRLRIAGLEQRRRAVAAQAARTLRIQGQPTLAILADSVPEARGRLLALRDQLKSAVTRVANRSHVAGRLAGALLGHLNTAVRLLAGAVEQTGVYTRQGIPQVSSRIGVIEAVA